MQMTEASFSGQTPIDGYGPGFFRIAGAVRRGAQLVYGAGAVDWGGFEDLAAIRALVGRIDVLFVGMGADIAFPPADFIAAVEEMGLMPEPMSSPSAARSYNVLLTEGRRVAVALLPMPGDLPPELARD
ncbi:Mth938-like domain-containing protein [Thioclava sp. GXIMD4216]|uniref:Mth938-like domain-containing protein n=1 Tax=Thioclava litoralis TaxID=3076557 RepID=A0ABZ1DXI3_9RHOB|nr:Mth938-like domain-containing protein [Thioclava sp. FTW29]